MTQAIVTQEEQEKRAGEFLSSIGVFTPSDLDKDIDEGFSKYTVQKNKSLIKRIDEVLTEKIEDGVIGAKDLISFKAELFKQIQNIEGNADTQDPSKLIPMNVVLNIQNNY